MAEPPLLRWDAPGPYVVGFTTRVGGVSDGRFASLNLGRRTGDDVARVAENRRLVCEALGADVATLAVNRQVHGTTVRRAESAVQGRPGDGLWTDEPGVPLLALAADCLPVALVRTDGDPAAAVVHAGWSGLLAGVLRCAVETLGGRVAAAIGPSAGPCCYRVGHDVAQPYRQRFGDAVLRGDRLDLWQAGVLELERAGVASVNRADTCTICNPDRFFSHRRDGLPRGVQGVLALVA